MQTVVICVTWYQNWDSQYADLQRAGGMIDSPVLEAMEVAKHLRAGAEEQVIDFTSVNSFMATLSMEAEGVNRQRPG
jgi:hypothetical protein